MIPSLLARQLRQGLSDYLRSAFPIANPGFDGMLEDFLSAEKELFRGPYISLGLPFVTADSPDGFFEGVPLSFPPYAHQEKAFRRLTGPDAKSTLVATGTGSGKTESFLLPILEHCWQKREKKGIKAILIYPMNALATDQAKRLAEIVHAAPSLQGTIRAGLWVGDREKSPRREMAADGIITDKEVMAKDPPDILLTNYKMLDILLNRPKDQGLWRNNEPETLRFIAVDELHTFDGAQGTDLACLLRRLKARLHSPSGHVIAIGTSATLGGPEAAQDLKTYAESIFGEAFDDEALVGEHREDALDFLKEHDAVEDRLPDHDVLAAVTDTPSLDDRALGQALVPLFFDAPPPLDEDWPIQLGVALKGHAAFQALLKALGGRALDESELLEALGRFMPGWGEADLLTQRLRLEALLALVALARVKVGERLRPFVHLRVQLWLRELRRMVASIGPEPKLRFWADLDEEAAKHHLPVVHCRDCGQIGWASIQRPRSNRLIADLKDFYQAFFSHDPETTFLFPVTDDSNAEISDGARAQLCGTCLAMTKIGEDDACPDCGTEHPVKVFVPFSFTDGNSGRRGHHDCPTCEAEDALTIVGLQAASVTSVLVGRLFSARLNDDKKLLTFSDSVQDASHRAGFFAARTQTVGLRTALATFLAQRDPAEPVTLATLADEFVTFWKQRLEPAAYVSQFLPPDLAWLRAFDELKSTDVPPPPDDLLWRYLDERLAFDIASEFGWRSRIGRTLEKSGTALARVAPSALEPVAESLRLRLSEDFATLRTLTIDEARNFLLGAVRQLRLMGAIALPQLARYITEGGQPFVFKTFKEYRYLPKLGPNKRPRLLASRKVRALEPLSRSPGEPQTWFQAWALKCWDHPDRIMLRAVVGDALLIAMKALVNHGLVEATPYKNLTIWALRPESLEIQDALASLRCGTCHQAIAVAEDERSAWEKAPCPRKACQGHLGLEESGLDYHGALYRHGDVARIHAAEHTGLLERDVRETVEREFMSRPPDRRPWHPNLLSCTPTLEMGIDIGDLSSVVLCSVPPAQANYLQRIGRAGRKDGNALALTVANARPHDLFFFAEPEEMLRGEVTPPGVFLGAAAVLERQLTAYCLDQWVATGVDAKAIPEKLRMVLPALKTQQVARFPLNFLTYVQQHEDKLLTGFLGLFDPPLAKEPTEHLTAFIAGGAALGGPMRFKIINAIERVATQVESLQKRIRRLSDLLNQHDEAFTRAQDHDEQRDALVQEKEALQTLIHDLLERDVYGFLTDEGMLPNYAFPEAGVELQSLIYRKKDATKPGDSSAYDKWTYRYERPARTALGELAPMSTFYAEGRRVKVDQVDMSVSGVEPWRFCPDCNHGELIIGEETAKECPCCASPMWADAAQRRELLRMRQVYATTEDKESRAGDESDTRENLFFQRHLAVDIPDGVVRAAYRLTDPTIPFGFEYLSSAEFRDINFGEKDATGTPWNLAGRPIEGKGFRICKHCGKVQPTASGAEPNHSLACAARKKDAADNFVEVVYLYRQFSSEALRMLLPVATLTSGETEVVSLAAALHLGLKRFYKGAIDHLQVTVMEEPDRETELRKRYLVLYDTVPGGTGYLKELAALDDAGIPALTRVLALARDHIRSCRCAQDPSKDGCYRCVYMYRNSREMASISRSVALTLLTQLLEHTEAWTKVDGLGDVNLATLSESVLEVRFLERIKALSDDWRMDLVDGKSGFTARFGKSTWRIVQQVELGPDQGVDIPMRADFVLTLDSYAGEEAARPLKPKPVVVFTDGFAYHRGRLDKDLAQRTALIRSGRYHVWSLSFWDVEDPGKPRGVDPLEPVRLPAGNYLDKMLEKFEQWAGLKTPRGVNGAQSLKSLLLYLSDPNDAAWRLMAFTLALSTVGKPQPTVAAWTEALGGRIPEELVAGWSSEAAVLGRVPVGLGELFVRIPQAALSVVDFAPERTVVVLAAPAEVDPALEAPWNSFLRALNMMQFLPGTQALAPGAAYRLPGRISIEADDPAWLDAFALTDASLHGLLERLRQDGLPAPEPGIDVSLESGKVLGNAELAWPSVRVALLTTDEWEHAEALRTAGWHVWKLENLVEESAAIDEVIAVVCETA